MYSLLYEMPPVYYILHFLFYVLDWCTLALVFGGLGLLAVYLYMRNKDEC